MMNAEVTCNDERLKNLLYSDDSTDDIHEASEHVETCDHCPKRLEQLAAGEGEWKEAHDMFVATSTPGDSGDEFDSARDSHRDDQVRQRWDHRARGWTEAVAQQLLSAPTHPEMMGRLGRYEVERLVGAGGMGVVFKAFDSELNRPVAVKVLAPHLAGSGAARKRFAREARAAAAIVHEHVVAIHNVETEAASPFLVMQYVPGESLQQRIDREGPLEICEILRIGIQTASGLSAAHAQGIVHRDVKPSNIMLERGVERTLLTDFGLARATDDASLTQSGHHPGTPQYMSPEQARGDAVDLRSDLFSLGSVIYTMCTGHSPFRADTTYAVLRRIVETDPRPVRELNADIPVWLEFVIGRMLANSAAERFQSGDELADLLQKCLAHVQQPTAVELPAECQPKSRSVGLGRKRTIAVGMFGLSVSALLAFNSGRFFQAPERIPSIVSPEQTSVTQDSQQAPSASAKDLNRDWETTANELRSLAQELSAMESRTADNWNHHQPQEE